MAERGSPGFQQGRAYPWIRSNVLGLVAIFIALSGSAVAVQVADDKGAQTAAKKKAKPGPPGPAGSQGPQGPQGLQGPVGPSTGQAGGDLTGNYPNPTLAVLPAARARGPVSAGVNCVFWQEIPSGTDTVVVWRGEDFDTAALHTTTSCPTPDPAASRLTAPRAGLYALDAGVKWVDDNVGERFLGLRVSGSTYVAGERIDALGGNGTDQTVSTLVTLAVGDYVEAVVFQSGAGPALLPASDSRNFLAAHWISPAS